MSGNALLMLYRLSKRKRSCRVCWLVDPRPIGMVGFFLISDPWKCLEKGEPRIVLYQNEGPALGRASDACQQQDFNLITRCLHSTTIFRDSTECCSEAILLVAPQDMRQENKCSDFLKFIQFRSGCRCYTSTSLFFSAPKLSSLNLTLKSSTELSPDFSFNGLFQFHMHMRNLHQASTPAHSLESSSL